MWANIANVAAMHDVVDKEANEALVWVVGALMALQKLLIVAIFWWQMRESAGPVVKKSFR